MKNKEVRYFDSEIQIEKREDGAVEAIEGHAAVFNKLSEDLGGFREKIDPGFFDSVLENDVRALVDHIPSKVLGRNKAGTLKLSVDKKGLKYRIEPIGNRSYEKDLVESLERGDVDQSSFGFRVDEDEWHEDKKGNVTRTLIKAKRLYDVSPVTFPAYPQTDVAKRSLDEWKKEHSEQEEEKPNADHTGEEDIKLSYELKRKKLALMEQEMEIN